MHVIRLRKPWEKFIGLGSIGRRVDVPDRETPDEDSGGPETRYCRRFNGPSGLSDQRVFLKISGWEGRLVSLTLNETALVIAPGVTSIECDISSVLRGHNELIVTLEATLTALPRLSGEVTLAIEE